LFSRNEEYYNKLFETRKSSQVNTRDDIIRAFPGNSEEQITKILIAYNNNSIKV
jgi:hypothetical protein